MPKSGGERNFQTREFPRSGSKADTQSLGNLVLGISMFYIYKWKPERTKTEVHYLLSGTPCVKYVS